MLEEIHREIIRGSPLWESLSNHKTFTALDCGVVRIGEETGKLYESLEFLAEYYRKKAAQRRMVTAALSYPLIILIVAVIVLVFMLLVIVPMFEQVYARMGGELPTITKAVIAFPR
ncbi:MAG: type II secretion system F family protein [Rikenellaceae bacterium]|nr:type II secretion system F family protein [Rikenellaceae bacterium]